MREGLYLIIVDYHSLDDSVGVFLLSISSNLISHCCGHTCTWVNDSVDICYAKEVTAYVAIMQQVARTIASEHLHPHQSAPILANRLRRWCLGPWRAASWQSGPQWGFSQAQGWVFVHPYINHGYTLRKISLTGSSLSWRAFSLSLFLCSNFSCARRISVPVLGFQRFGQGFLQG